MEFTIQRNVFLNGIQKTLGIVEKKTTMPILNNLLLKAEERGIRIMATDREIGLVTNHEAEVISQGDITLSARKLHEMVREIQGERIHVVKDERNAVILSCDKAVYKLPGIPADDYPQVTDHEDLPLSRIKGVILGDLIRKTFFAVSTDEMRKNLNGIFLETEMSEAGGTVRMVATDGHRLATAVIETGEKEWLVLEKGVILPRKGVSEIRRLVEDEPGDIGMGFRQGVCYLKTEQTLLRVSLIDAEYPDYRRVIPSEKGVVIGVQKDKILHALRRMSVISSDRYNGVILKISSGRLVLNSTNPDVGEANDELEIDYQGEEKGVGYNVSYLADAIEVVEGDGVELEIGEGMKPAIIRGTGQGNYFCIVMPLKL